MRKQVCRIAAIGIVTLLGASGAVAADVGTLVKQCEDFHGNKGVSEWDDVPTIAGISAPVHGDFLFAYQDKTRPCRESKFRQGDTSRPPTDMCAVAAKLSWNSCGPSPMVSASSSSNYPRRCPLASTLRRAWIACER